MHRGHLVNIIKLGLENGGQWRGNGVIPVNDKSDLIVGLPLQTRQTAEPTMARFPDVPVETWPVQEFTSSWPSRSSMTNIIDLAQRLPTPASPVTVDACLNCGTVPVGPWCHDCGQKGGHVHRSVLHLLAEFLETFTHADSRFWRTMRRLAVNPARLTNDYLAGKRVSEIPLLRLFFVMLFLLFGVGSLTHGHVNFDLPPQAHQQASAELQKITIGHSASATHWLRSHLQKAVDRPEEVLAVASDWAERFAFLMLPIAAAILWVLFLPRRGSHCLT